MIESGGVVMQSLALVSLSELKWFELTCECGASVTFDMSKDEALFPDHCPSCKKTWNGFTSGAIVAAFKNFKNFYSVFAATKFRPRFRVVIDSGTSTAK